jgi:uncharacterized protein (DUF302 family)
MFKTKTFFYLFLTYIFSACSGHEVPVYEFNTDEMIRVETTLTPITAEERLLNLLSESEFRHSNTIDHKSSAKNIGMNIYEARVIVFGKPEVEIPLLNCRQTIGVDLPFRITIYKDEEEKTWLLYNDPLLLVQKHRIFDKDCKEVLSQVSDIVHEIVLLAGKGVEVNGAISEDDEERIEALEQEATEEIDQH